MSQPTPRPEHSATVLLMDAEEAHEAASLIRDGLMDIDRKINHVRAIALDFHRREGWRALGYRNWRECARAEFSQSQAQVYRQLTAGIVEERILLALAEHNRNGISPMGEKLEPGQIPERVLREFAKLPADQQGPAFVDTFETTGGFSTSAAARTVNERIRGPVDLGNCEVCKKPLVIPKYVQRFGDEGPYLTCDLCDEELRRKEAIEKHRKERETEARRRDEEDARDRKRQADQDHYDDLYDRTTDQLMRASGLTTRAIVAAVGATIARARPAHLERALSTLELDDPALLSDNPHELLLALTRVPGAQLILLAVLSAEVDTLAWFLGSDRNAPDPDNRQLQLALPAPNGDGAHAAEIVMEPTDPTQPPAPEPDPEPPHDPGPVVLDSVDDLDDPDAIRAAVAELFGTADVAGTGALLEWDDDEGDRWLGMVLREDPETPETYQLLTYRPVAGALRHVAYARTRPAAPTVWTFAERQISTAEIKGVHQLRRGRVIVTRNDGATFVLLQPGNDSWEVIAATHTPLAPLGGTVELSVEQILTTFRFRDHPPLPPEDTAP